jgi:hypothetical protein
MFRQTFLSLAVFASALVSFAAILAILDSSSPLHILSPGQADGYTFSLKAIQPSGPRNVSPSAHLAERYTRRGLEVPGDLAAVVERSAIAARAGPTLILSPSTIG